MVRAALCPNRLTIRHDAVVDDVTLMVNIVDEHVERFDALLKSPFDRLPFDLFDDCADNVKRPNFFGARFVP